MSHQASINFQNVEAQCNSICNIAKHRLDELEEMIKVIEDNALSLLNFQSDELKKSILEERDKLHNKIDVVSKQALKDAEKGTMYVSYQEMNNINEHGTVSEAKKLESFVNELSSSKIIEFKALIDSLLKQNIKNSYDNLVNKNHNTVITQNLEYFLNSISDSNLKQYVYLAYISNNSLTNDELLKKGKEMMAESLNMTYEQRLALEEERIRKELEEARVDKSIIEKVVANNNGTNAEKLTQMQEKATTEIINESVRQQSLKAIMKAISNRGFIVAKNNIKINRETNEVNMVAMKASGERADFKVYLDGKFIYDFHQGYQGQACQKDIEPFINDLEEVYGFKITKQEDIWINPDKISTMKYQQMNTRKNKE